MKNCPDSEFEDGAGDRVCVVQIMENNVNFTAEQHNVQNAEKRHINEIGRVLGGCVFLFVLFCIPTIIGLSWT